MCQFIMANENRHNIEIKPSTELIPDEYPHFDNSKASVHIFRGDGDKDTSKALLETLKYCEYKVPKDNVHKLDNKKDVEKKLTQISKQDYSDTTCFILFFMGRTTKNKTRGCILPDKEGKDGKPEIYIKDVWSKFILNKHLKNKPKIFIFQASAEVEKIAADSIREGDSQYDLPVEADLFITYKLIQNGDDRGRFIQSICENIRRNGQRDDIIDIVTHTDNSYDYKTPLMISTLTRKFYVTSSETRMRGYHHDISSHIGTISCSIKALQLGIDNNIKRTRSDQSINKPTYGSLSSLNVSPSPVTTDRRNSATPSPTIFQSFRPRSNSKNSKPPWK